MEEHPATGAYFEQDGCDARFEWGSEGVRWLAPCADLLIIVDVLSFTTCVDVAVACGGAVYPYRWHDVSATAYAARIGARLAVRRGQTDAAHPYSLSPVTLQAMPPGERLVLPSPNGSTLAFLAAEAGVPVLADCLRNAGAVAAAARTRGASVTVIAAGERWGHGEGPLRPAVEDLIGAGAILAALKPAAPSPEAQAAMAAYAAAAPELRRQLLACSSGRELRQYGYAQDVALAAEHDVSEVVPIFQAGAFIAAPARRAWR